MAAKKSSSKRPASSMEELMSALSTPIKTFSTGEKISAKLVEKTGKSAIFDIGGKTEGIVVGEHFDGARNYLDSLKKGEKVSATIVSPDLKDGFIPLSLSESSKDALWERLESAKKDKSSIKVHVNRTSDKGLTVSLGSISGFIPASHLGKQTSKNISKLQDKDLKVKILELNKSTGKAIFSERAISEADIIAKQERALKSLKKGDTFTGTVKDLTGFGAFVEIKVDKTPIEGLVHVSEISWQKVAKPADALSVGDKVKVAILGTDNGKISLSIKSTTKDPWETAAEKFKVEDKVSGKVVRMSDFGAFVEIAPGIEGLLHITKIPPDKKLEPGSSINCYIEELDIKEKRISLGLVLTTKPMGYK